MIAQPLLLQEAIALAPSITLGEAYRHVSSSTVLEDFIQRLEPMGLTQDSCSLEALNTLARGSKGNLRDQRRLLALCKLVVRVKKTRDRLTKDHWLTERQAAKARRSP